MCDKYCILRDKHKKPVSCTETAVTILFFGYKISLPLVATVRHPITDSPNDPEEIDTTPML